MFDKHFTLKEANHMLPEVKVLVSAILEKGKALRALLPDHKNAVLSVHAEALIKEVEYLMARLEEKGCFYKDWNFEIGLVDFPAIIDGEEALLCWKSDEQEILWYHSHEDGFAGRRPIPSEWLLEDLFKNG